jgi:hypothetical protein
VHAEPLHEFGHHSVFMIKEQRLVEQIERSTEQTR